jgi:hypothetical protein
METINIITNGFVHSIGNEKTVMETISNTLNQLNMSSDAIRRLAMSAKSNYETIIDNFIEAFASFSTACDAKDQGILVGFIGSFSKLTVAYQLDEEIAIDDFAKAFASLCILCKNTGEQAIENFTRALENLSSICNTEVYTEVDDLMGALGTLTMETEVNMGDTFESVLHLSSSSTSISSNNNNDDYSFTNITDGSPATLTYFDEEKGLFFNSQDYTSNNNPTISQDPRVRSQLPTLDGFNSMDVEHARNKLVANRRVNRGNAENIIENNSTVMRYRISKHRSTQPRVPYPRRGVGRRGAMVTEG